MAVKKVSIKSDGTTGGTKIFLDGEEVSLPMVEVQFTASSGDSPKVNLVLLVNELEVEVDEDQAHWSFLRFPKPKALTKFFGPKD